MRRLAVVVLAFSVAGDLSAATRTWTGSAGTNWTVASNWVGGSAPVAGDDLVFPESGANQSSSNNFPTGTSFNSILFTGGTYHLFGAPITLGAGGIDVTGGVFHQINMLVTPGAAQTWVLDRGTAGASVNVVNLNGMALAISANGNFAPNMGVIIGAGSISLTGPGAGLNLNGVSTATAPFTITSDTLFVHGTYSGPLILGNSGKVAIDPGKTVGTVTATGLFGEFQPGFSFPNGVANSGNVTLIANSLFDISINTASDFSSLNLTGTIDFGGADLSLGTGQTMIAPGTTFTIVNNDGSDPVGGTFRGLAEGAQVVTSFQTQQIFRVSYIGGSGNDVVLTAVGPATATSTTLTSSSNPSLISASVTLTAKVTAFPGTATPAGSVDFLEFISPATFTKLATVQLDSTGTATFTTSSLTQGSHFLRARFNYNNAPFAPSTGFLTQTVTATPPRRRAVR